MKRFAVCAVLMLFTIGFATASTWTKLDYPGAVSTQIYGISGSTLAGNYTDALGVHGFLYNGNIWTSFDVPAGNLLPEKNRMQVTGIDGGNVVGWYGVDDWPEIGHGFIYNDSGFMAFDLPGANNTAIYGIDGSNIIFSADKQRYIYNLSTQATIRIDIPGPPFGIDGTNIVGYYIEASHDDFVVHGFIYNGANWTTLDMPGSTQTRIQGIDGSNIVGWGFLYNITTDIWTPLNMPGARTTFAQAIDDNRVVGFYTDSALEKHGFLYTIPEPATLLLLGLGGMMARRKK